MKEILMFLAVLSLIALGPIVILAEFIIRSGVK